MKINLHQEYKFTGTLSSQLSDNVDLCRYNGPWLLSSDDYYGNLDWIRMRLYEDLSKSDESMWQYFPIPGYFPYYVDKIL